MARRPLLRLRRRLACEAGYTLTELLTVLAIMSLVLAGLAVMFQAGIKAEVRATRELQAQQNARAALDRMRRELHCANALTTPDAATVTVTLSAACPGTATSVTYAAASVSANRWQLTRSADGGAAVAVADYLTANTLFTYTAPGSGSLGRLSVNFPVNLNPSDTTTLWRLEDDIVLRNTVRV
jgi:prepilin-type N-terminal cleavage/methylation domain-containing protein